MLERTGREPGAALSLRRAAPAFLLHGAGTLMLESAWVKAQVALFGSVPAAPGSVLVAYFLGVALGSARWSRGEIADRRAFPPLAAALLLGAGLSFVPGAALAGSGGHLPAWLLSTPALWAAVALSVLPASTAIGAFFPLIGRLDGGRRALVLYGLEAAGALPGLVLGAWVLPGALGFKATALAGAATVLAAWTLLAQRASRPGRAVGAGGPGVRPAVRLLALAAGSGFLSMLLQSVWIRLVALRSDNSVFSFVAVSFLLISLITVGSFLVDRLPLCALAAPWLPAALGCAVVAGGVGAGLVWVRVTDGLSIRLVANASGLGASFALAAPLVVAGSALASLLFPLVLRLGRVAVGEVAGGPPPEAALVGVNALGCALGAAAGAFALLPRLGTWPTLFAALCGYLALLAVAPGRGRLVAAAAGAALLAAGSPLRHPLVTPADPFGGPPGRVAWVREGSYGTVAVVEYPGGIRSLWLNDTYLLEAYTGSPQATARLGALPVALHPRAREIALIGLGTGLTAAGALRPGVEHEVVLELVPEVAAAAGELFADYNGHLLSDPRVRLVVADGRRFFEPEGVGFDVVSTDLVTPWQEGAASLFTLEHFRAVRAHLRPGGIFCLWLPLYQLTRGEFLAVARTMTAAFPSVTLWELSAGSERPALALVGGTAPLDAGEIAAAFADRPVPPGEEEPIHIHASGVFSRYVGPVDPADPLLRDAPLNTLDRPVVEFSAARAGRVLATDGVFQDLVGHFYGLPGNPGGRFFSGYAPVFEQWRQAGRALTRYAWYLRIGDFGHAAELEPRFADLPAYRTEPGRRGAQ